MAERDNIERQPLDNTNAQKSDDPAVPTGKPRYTGGFSGAARPTGTVPKQSKLKTDYTSVYRAKDYHPFQRSGVTKRTPPESSTTMTSSEVIEATELEKKMLSDAVQQLKDDIIQIAPIQVHTEPTTEKDVINVDTSMPNKPIEVDSDEDDDPKEPHQSREQYEKQLYTDLTNNPLSYSDRNLQMTNSILHRMSNLFSFDYVNELTYDDVKEVLMWMRPGFKHLRPIWQNLILFSTRYSSDLVVMSAFVAAFCHQSTGQMRLQQSLGEFVGTYIHIHLAQLESYAIDKGEKVTADDYSALIMGNGRFLDISPVLNIQRPFNNDDLLSLNSMLSANLEEAVQRQVDLCHLIINTSPALHTDQQKMDIAGAASLEAQGAGKPRSPIQGTSPAHSRPTSPAIVISRPGDDTLSPMSIGRRSPTPAKTPLSPRPHRPTPLIPANISMPIIQRLDTESVNIQVKKDIKKAREEHDRRVNRAVSVPGIPEPLSMIYDASTKMKAIEIIDDDEFVAKYGADSVITVGAVDTAMMPAPDSQPSTILGILASIINTAYDAYAVTNTAELKARVLGTLISLPDVEPPYRQLYANDSFPMMVLKENNLQPFRVLASGAHPLPTVIAAPEYVCSQSGSIDTKAMTSAIQSVVSGFSRQMAEGIANLAQPNVSRHSMLSLFTKMWTIYLTLVSCEELGVVPHFQGFAPDDVVTQDISLTNQGLQDGISVLSNAINAGIPILETSEINVNSIHCMRLISAGTAAIHTPAAYTHLLVGNRILWDEVTRWLIIGRGTTLPPMPPHVRVTPVMMLDFIYLMTRLYHRNDDMVNGFIRASLMLTCQIITVRSKSTGLSSQLVNSMLEMYATVMPISRADNVIWRLLKATKAETTCPSADNEVKYLTLQNAAYYGHLSTATAVMISYGYSSVFHSLNISGTTLTSYARNVPTAVVTDLIKDLTAIKMNEYIPQISRIAAGYLPQIGAMSISPLALLSTNWSGFGLTAASSNPVHSWRRAWPSAAPYLGQPTSTLRYNTTLDSNWGLSQPGIKGDFKSEVKQYDVAHHLFWSACAGDPAYQANAQSNISYLYIPYGAIALNTLMQQTRLSIGVPLRFIEISRVNTADGIVFALQPVPWDLFHFMFTPVLCCLRIGSLLCYDWARGSVMSPALILSEQPETMSGLLELEIHTELRRAGLRYAGIRTHTPLNTNLEDVLNFKRLGLKQPKEQVKVVEPPKEQPKETPKETPKPTPEPPKVEPKVIEPKPEAAKVETEVKKAVEAVPATPVVNAKK